MDINVKNYYFKGAQKRYVTNFRGDLTRNIRTLQLKAKEVKQISAVESMYRQINMIFSASGEYMKGLLKAGVGFLTAMGSAFMLQNTLQSNDVQNVKLEKDDDKMSFIVNGDERDDVLKISISKNGNAEVFADADLSEAELNKYINEFDKNHSKLFGTVFQRLSDAFQAIGQVLSKKQSGYNFDLNSKDNIIGIVKQFVDEKRRLSLLGTLIDARTFTKNFEFEKGMPKSYEQGELIDENISFTFSNLENRFFKGLQITVTDKNNNTRQGFVAMDDGNIYKTKLHDLSNPEDKFVPRMDWRIRRLESLTPDELENPLLKRMFEYAYSHVDKVTKFYMNYLYEQNKSFAQKYDKSSDRMKNQIDRLEKARMERINKFNAYLDKLNSKKNARTEAQGNSRLAEDAAKTIKVYDLAPEDFDLVKKLSSLNDRISTANTYRQYSQKQNFIKNFGIIRRKFQNGLIFKDVLNTDQFYLGLARYIYNPDKEEILSLGLFDNNLEEIARFKATKNGKIKLIVKPNTAIETVEKIENIMKNEMEKGLAEKLYSRMEMSAYYLENAAKVDSYMAKSYKKLSINEAIHELRENKLYYKFDSSKVRSLKEKLDGIREIYRKHESACYRWQDMYYPEFTQLPRYMQGRLENQDIDYEISVIDNKRYFSGLRILTRNKNGTFTNCYTIDYDGNTYKLINLPKNNKYSYINYTNKNSSPLDEQAVKNEYLDLMFDELLKNIRSYKAFLDECAYKLEIEGQYKFLKSHLEPIISKYKNGAQEFVPEIHPRQETIEETTVREIQQEEKTTPRKVGRPKKTVDKAVSETKKPKKADKPKKAAVVKTAPKTVVPKKEKPTVKPNSVVTKRREWGKTERTLSPELKDRYANMLKPNGQFKSLQDISLEDVVNQLDRIFALPPLQRSSHFVHDLNSKGDIFANRFSVLAPDGAWITVTKNVMSEYSPFHYSIRVQKENEIMYLNIKPDSDRVIRCDENNKIMLDSYGEKLTISKKKFMEKNPLSENMPMYFMEMFDERSDGERETIKFQVFNDKNYQKLEQQKTKEFQATLSAKMTADIQKELEQEMDETEESEEI